MVIEQGDIWLLETPNDKRRPVLIVTRNEALNVLNNVVVAPLTSTVRTIPTCIPLGRDEGVDHDCVASFDNLASVPKALLTNQLGALGSQGPRLICSALESLADC
jgi:mRNA interferase MazF